MRLALGWKNYLIGIARGTVDSELLPYQEEEGLKKRAFLAEPRLGMYCNTWRYLVLLLSTIVIEYTTIIGDHYILCYYICCILLLCTVPLWRLTRYPLAGTLGHCNSSSYPRQSLYTLMKLSQILLRTSLQTITRFPCGSRLSIVNTHPQPPASSRPPRPSPPSTSGQTAPAASQNTPC